MPAIVIPLSLVGLVPFIVFGLAALGSFPPNAQRGLTALIDYAAVILAFSGGVHWGLAMLPEAARPTAQIAAGALPMIVAWVGLVLAQMLAPWVGLAVLILGYLGTVLTEHRAAQRFLVPTQYVWVRWGFCGVAVLVMAAVLVLSGFRQTIVF